MRSSIHGRRELIDFMVMKHESKKRWEAFLNNLYNCGLTGKSLGLLVTDGNAGLENALEDIYPYV